VVQCIAYNWKKETTVETCIGLEINGYLPAVTKIGRALNIGRASVYRATVKVIGGPVYTAKDIERLLLRTNAGVTTRFGTHGPDDRPP
jgi:hypothetical protein